MSTNKYIGTQCSFHGVCGVMLLWLLRGRPAEVENIGLSAWPRIIYNLDSLVHPSKRFLTLRDCGDSALTCISEWLKKST